MGPGPAKALLVLEYVSLFFGLPILYHVGWVPLPLILALWVLAAGCATALLADPRFNRRQMWNASDLGRRLFRACIPFVVVAPVLLLGTLLFEPDRCLAFVRRRPLVWAVVMVLYPILSAYPQGLVYRTFVFQRYGRVFSGRWTTILASAVAFSFAHVVFHNWVAPVLSFGGGLLFAWTYDRTRSSLVATAQHALFGCYLFTVGLGWYFYHGAVGR